MSSVCQWNGKACVCLHEGQSMALQWNTAGVGGVPPAAIRAQNVSESQVGGAEYTGLQACHAVQHT